MLAESSHVASATDYSIVIIKREDQMKPFQILGKLYAPTDSRVNPLREVLYVSSCDIRNREWCYRRPATTAQMAANGFNNLVNDWHQDGGHFNGVILWSNEYPTEVRMKSGRRNRKIYAGEPGDVILIDNQVVEHRPPREFIELAVAGKPTNKHLIRCILNGYPSDEQVNEWKGQLSEHGSRQRAQATYGLILE